MVSTPRQKTPIRTFRADKIDYLTKIPPKVSSIHDLPPQFRALYHQCLLQRIQTSFKRTPQTNAPKSEQPRVTTPTPSAANRGARRRSRPVTPQRRRNGLFVPPSAKPRNSATASLTASLELRFQKALERHRTASSRLLSRMEADHNQQGQSFIPEAVQPAGRVARMVHSRTALKSEEQKQHELYALGDCLLRLLGSPDEVRARVAGLGLWRPLESVAQLVSAKEQQQRGKQAQAPPDLTPGSAHEARPTKTAREIKDATQLLPSLHVPPGTKKKKNFETPLDYIFQAQGPIRCSTIPPDRVMGFIRKSSAAEYFRDWDALFGRPLLSAPPLGSAQQYFAALGADADALEEQLLVPGPQPIFDDAALDKVPDALPDFSDILPRAPPLKPARIDVERLLFGEAPGAPSAAKTPGDLGAPHEEILRELSTLRLMQRFPTRSAALTTLDELLPEEGLTSEEFGVGSFGPELPGIREIAEPPPEPVGRIAALFSETCVALRLPLLERLELVSRFTTSAQSLLQFEDCLRERRDLATRIGQHEQDFARLYALEEEYLSALEEGRLFPRKQLAELKHTREAFGASSSELERSIVEFQYKFKDDLKFEQSNYLREMQITQSRDIQRLRDLQKRLARLLDGEHAR